MTQARIKAHEQFSMLGSLTFYRRLLNDSIFSNPSLPAIIKPSAHRLEAARVQTSNKLPTIGHALAGVMAGATVSFIAGLREFQFLK